jgi:uncharacterized protein YjaG (DUF416 family)
MEQQSSFDYDEARIADRLAALPLASRVLFGCACAERLMPAYRWFCHKTGSGDFELVRQILDAGWSMSGPDLAPEPESGLWREQIGQVVPGDDDEALLPGSAVAQNAVASVAYVLEAWCTGDGRASVWAARQLYEAADVIVQQGAAAQSYVEDISNEAPVQLVLAGISSALDDLADPDPRRLLEAAQRDGDAFLAFLAG